MKEVENDTQSEYELTSLGLLPKNWSVVQFSQIADFNLGRTPPRKTQEYWDQGKYPWVSIKDMDTFGRIQKTKEKISSIALKDIFRNSCVPKDTLLMSFKLTIGKTSILDIDAVHNEAIISIFPYDTILKEFLLYYLPTIDYSEYFDKAVKGNTLNKSKIRRILIPLPPLPEQHAIAHVLRTVQEAREKTEAVIEAAKTLKKSMMQYLFTYGPVPIDEAEQVPLKETEVGMVPEGWEVVKMGDLIRDKITDGVHKTPNYTDSGIPFISAVNMEKDSLNFSKCKFISNDDHENLSQRCNPEKNDILMCKVGATIGKIAKINVDFSFSIFVQIALIKPNISKINSDFMKYVLISKKGQLQILTNASQSTMPFIGINKIEMLVLPYPNIQEQGKIANIMVNIEQKIAAEESRKAALDQLFQTLLHDLMTAKIRVNHLSVPVAET